MTEKPTISKIEFHHGQTVLTAGIRTFVIDTMFDRIGQSPDAATALWTTATTDPGAHGDQARQWIERVTGIRITIKTEAV